MKQLYSLAVLILLLLISCGDDEPTKPGITDKFVYDTLDIPKGSHDSFLRIRKVKPNPSVNERLEMFQIQYYGADTLNLAGWYIMDDENVKWGLGKFMIIFPDQNIEFESDKESAQLLNSGDVIHLVSSLNETVQTFSFGASDDEEWKEPEFERTLIIKYDTTGGVMKAVDRFFKK